MRSPTLTDHLGEWLDEGRTRIGELLVLRRESGWRLLHHADREIPALSICTNPHDAIALARLDAEGKWRPLRSAPSLTRGWALDLPDLESVRLALEFLYPAALGNYAAFRSGALAAAPLREVLERQTGMYRVTRHLTDTQAGELVPVVCSSTGCCLKTILWSLNADQPVPSLPSSKSSPAIDQTGAPGPFIPLLCTEACPLLIGAVRDKVKGACR